MEGKMCGVCQSSDVEAVAAEKVLETELELKTDPICLLRDKVEKA